MQARGNAVAQEKELAAKEIRVVGIRSQLPCKQEWRLKVVKILTYLILVCSAIVVATVTVTIFLNNRAVFHPVQEVSLAPTISSQNVVCPERLEEWMRPPPLMHNMSDEELLWRASMAPDRREYPFERVPKIAFMFLTKGPMSLVPLWEKFLRGHEGFYSIYVHASPSFKLDVAKTSPFYRREIPSQVVEWGQISMYDAERRILANALLEFSNERFVLLSEACIPVFNFSTIYNYLIKSKHSFVDSFDDWSSAGRGRYTIKMAPEVNVSQWRKGSQWFEVHRKLAIKIISETKYYQIFKELCKPPCFSDEHYLPTMLTMLFGPLISNRSITWADWSRRGPHPAMFGEKNITEGFTRTIRDKRHCAYNNQTGSLCYMFARKFAPSGLDTLLNMSSIVLEFDS